VESDVDYVKMLQKNITKFEFCAAWQEHFVGMSVFSYRVKYKTKQNAAGLFD